MPNLSKKISSTFLCIALNIFCKEITVAQEPVVQSISQAAPRQQLLSLLASERVSRGLYVATKLGIEDRLQPDHKLTEFSILEVKNMNQTSSFKNIAEEYAHRIWDKKDLTAIIDLMHPEVVIHSLLGDYHGPEQMQKVVNAWLIAFPDLIVQNQAMICEADNVVIRWRAHGTHTGEFKGMQPTGKSIAYEGVTIYKVANAKIIEYWAYLDMEHLLNQIRHTPNHD